LVLPAGGVDEPAHSLALYVCIGIVFIHVGMDCRGLPSVCCV
jgi:hypothetical protein